jgi:hypothetical protein
MEQFQKAKAKAKTRTVTQRQALPDRNIKIH